MKKLLFATAAIAAMGIAAPQAGAQSDANLAHPEIYMQQDAGGAYRLFGPDFPAEGQQVMYDENGRPQDCPAGSWFIEQNEQTDEFDQVRGCDDTEVGYDVGPMPGDAEFPSGGQYSAMSPDRNGDTYLVTPRVD